MLKSKSWKCTACKFWTIVSIDFRWTVTSVAFESMMFTISMSSPLLTNTNSFSCWLNPRHHTHWHAHTLHLTIPWWPSWMPFLSTDRMTNLVPLSKSPSCTVRNVHTIQYILNTPEYAYSRPSIFRPSILAHLHNCVHIYVVSSKVFTQIFQVGDTFW